MRKTLSIVIVVVFVVALMVVPAFADSLIAGTLNAEGYMELPYLPEPGRYLLSAEFVGLDNEIVSISQAVDLQAVEFGLAGILSYVVTDDVSVDGTIAIAPWNAINSDFESASIGVVYVVGEVLFNFTSFSLSPALPDGGAVVEELADVYNNIVGWFVDAIGSVEAIFWDSTTGSFTTIGTVAIMGLAVSLAMLLLNVVRDFFRLR